MSNPILKKELHLLKGPRWAARAFLLSIVCLAFLSNTNYVTNNITWILIPYAMLLCYCITATFGIELESQSLAPWIMQPRKRSELWNIKIRTLGRIYAVYSLGFGSLLFFLWTYGWPHVGSTIPFYVIWLACVFFGPGIYFTLKLRNPTASFWATLAIPMLSWPVVGLLLNSIVNLLGGSISNILAFGILVTISLIYGVWGFLAAKKQFLLWEDVGIENNHFEFQFRNPKNKKKSETSITNRKPYPIRRYLLNELRIQQFNILIGILMVGAIWGTHYWALHRSVSVHPNDETQRMIEMLPSMFRYMLFLLPCSIAALSIADNRRQDVITWELMLPLSRHTKWGIKFVTCLLLSWIFTMGLTWTYDSKILFSSVQPEIKTIIFYVLIIAAIVIGSLSFYISSLTSSFLKSFSFSLGLLPLMAFFLAFIHFLYQEEQGSRAPIGFFTVVTGVIILISLCALWWSRTNFSNPQILIQSRALNWNRWGWSCVVIALWLGIMIDRTWERITLIEEASDPSKILTANNIRSDSWSKDHLFTHESKFGSPISIQKVNPKLGDSLNFACIALCQDGRMYFTDNYQLDRWGPQYHETQLSRKVTMPIFLKKGISEGADLISPAIVAATDATFYHRLILDTEGHLFMWDQKAEKKFTESNSPGTEPILLTPLSKDQQYRSLCARGGAFYVIDKFDKLWGAQYEKDNGRYTRKLSNFEKLFPDETWQEISNAPVGVVALKNDGTLWTWGSGHIYLGVPKEQRPDESQLVQIFQDRNWKSLHPNSNNLLIEAEDGSLWIPNFGLFSAQQRQTRAKKLDSVQYRFLCKIDIPDLIHYWLPDYDFPKSTPFYWISNKGGLYAADLVLENLDPNSNEALVAKPINVRQIGNRNDWVYLTQSAGMTADGKIWNWDRIQTNRWNPFPARFRHKVVAEVRP